MLRAASNKRTKESLGECSHERWYTHFGPGRHPTPASNVRNIIHVVWQDRSHPTWRQGVASTPTQCRRVLLSSHTRLPLPSRASPQAPESRDNFRSCCIYERYGRESANPDLTHEFFENNNNKAKSERIALPISDTTGRQKRVWTTTATTLDERIEFLYGPSRFIQSYTRIR